MVLGDRAFGRWLVHRDGSFMSEISALIRKRPQRALSTFPSCKDTGRRWPSMNQEVGSHQTLNLLVPWSWTSQSPELWEIVVCCLSQFGIFLVATWTKRAHDRRMPYILCVWCLPLTPSPPSFLRDGIYMHRLHIPHL